jgi:hypothetical protein
MSGMPMPSPGLSGARRQPRSVVGDDEADPAGLAHAGESKRPWVAIAIGVCDGVRARLRDGQGDVRWPLDAVQLGERSRRLAQFPDPVGDGRDGQGKPVRLRRGLPVCAFPVAPCPHVLRIADLTSPATDGRRSGAGRQPT